MDDGMQWLAGTILSAVISSVITVGFLSALVTRLQIRIDPGRAQPSTKKAAGRGTGDPASGIVRLWVHPCIQTHPDRLRGQGRDSGIPAGAARNRLYERCG